MKHYGDITKLSGYELPVVDVITGGSPCQDLSVAGKRAGLAGERSGLFMEQMRIVKEMREHDRLSGRSGFLVRPRYMVWENVPGAFSSGSPKGADFAAVIEEIIKVAEPGAAVCVRVPDGGWPKSGCYYADDGAWSVAWRVHDAQFWGVPQRRKRISLVADFGGLSAPEILFERQGLRRDTEPGETEGQGTAGGAEGGAGGAISFQERAEKPGGGKGILIQEEHVGALSTLNNQSVFAYGIDPVMTTSGPKVMCLNDQGNGDGDVVPTITGDHENRVTDYTALCMDVGFFQTHKEQVGTLLARQYKDPPIVKKTYQRQTGSLLASGYSKNGTPEAANGMYITGNRIRRLTPLECERLQGYPDGWTEIGDWTDSKGKKRKAADGPRYKALGNSIALPFWQFLARRICAQYERDITLGSLFDGIGGFPYVFERCGAKAVWASEIEEFAIAVTKKRFPEECE